MPCQFKPFYAVTMKLNLSIPFETTPCQAEAIRKLEDFFAGSKRVFIMKGFAGSGKTTLLGGLARALERDKKKFRLMAPTGRAARVLSRTTGLEATTIHRGIYSLDDLRETQASDPEHGRKLVYYFSLRMHDEVGGTTFIVDESSMISNVYSQGETFRFGSGRLLDDLMTYARIGDPEAGTRIVFAGDPAQLPPVGMSTSPALDEAYFLTNYRTQCLSATLTAVTRQQEGSHIIRVADMVRESITTGRFSSFFIPADGKEIIRLKENEWREKYLEMAGEKLIIAHKNHTVNAINREVRNRLLGGFPPIGENDRVISCANNYLYGIMNGEFGKVIRAATSTIKRTVHLQGKNGKKKKIVLSWREVEVDFQGNGGDGKTINAYMLENFLEGGPVLSPEERQALYVDFRMRHKKLKPRDPEFKIHLKNDPWFQALFLRYGYAVTCHKAQGGEWDDVLVFWDYGFIPRGGSPGTGEKTVNLQHADFFRWAYTAMTRAGKRLFLLEPPCFHPFTGMFHAVVIPEKISQLPEPGEGSDRVVVDHNWQKRLEEVSLDSAGRERQDHYIRLTHRMEQAGIQVRSVNRKYYEVFYTLGCEKETARFKFWLNGKEKFTGRFAPVPAGTGSQALSEKVSAMLENLDSIEVIRPEDQKPDPAETEDEKRLFEEYPFLETLSRTLSMLVPGYRVTISRRDHLPYRERYHFIRHGQRAAVDFIYNSRGRFTRAETVCEACNSRHLLTDLKEMIEYLTRNDMPCRSGKQ